MSDRSPPPHYPPRAWLKEEDDKLRELKNEGVTNVAIGRQLFRSKYAIERRVRRLKFPPSRFFVNWEPEHDALLKEFWSQKDVKIADIGISLKRTRNAVIGRAHRLGLPPRGRLRLSRRPKSLAPPQLRPRIPRTPRHDKTGQPFLLRHYGPQVAPTMVPNDPYQPGTGVPLLEATSDQCRAIVVSSKDNNGLAVFCGEPQSPYTRYSFCEYHRQRYTYRR